MSLGGVVGVRVVQKSFPCSTKARLSWPQFGWCSCGNGGLNKSKCRGTSACALPRQQATLQQVATDYIVCKCNKSHCLKTIVGANLCLCLMYRSIHGHNPNSIVA